MGRRSRLPVNRHVDGSRSSIGDVHVNEACAKLDRTTLIETALMITEVFTTVQIVPMVFKDDSIARLTAAQGLVRPDGDIGHYSIPAGRSLHIDFSDFAMPTPTQLAFVPYKERCERLDHAIDTVTQIREKYAAVKWLLRWFNTNATPAAVRALWPSVLSLCPNSPLCKEYAEMPTRYTAPDKIGALLAVLRDTAQTVAGMQLIPGDARARNRGHVWLTFNSGNFIREDVEISGDIIHVNL